MFWHFHVEWIALLLFVGLRQSAEGDDVVPDLPGDGGGGGDGSSGSDSEDNAGPAGKSTC